MALAREGVRLAISSRSAEALDEAAAELGGGVVALPADTEDLDRMAALPGEVAEALGPVEILVTNTGGPPRGRRLRRTTPRSGRRPTARWCRRRGYWPRP